VVFLFLWEMPERFFDKMKNTLSLRLNYEFSKVYRRGEYIPGKYVVLHFIKNTRQVNRLGVTTSKKVRGSVPRNRMRRLIREGYRLKECNIRKGYDIILLGRENPKDIKQDQINRDIVYLFKRAGIWEDDVDSSIQGGTLV
jgi:ribonuclease P protein component